MIQPRDYQSKLVDGIIVELKQGKNPIAVLPTGGGKTVIFSYLAQRSAKKGKKTLILCHRTKLVDQTVETLEKFGLKAQSLKAGFKRINPKAVVYVGMIQTLARRDVLDVDIIYADECHIANFDPYLLKYKGKVPFVGFTATPWRASKRKKLSDIYDSIVQEIDTPELIEKGYLCPADYYGFNEETLPTTKGADFEDDSNIDYVGKAGSALENYEKFAKGTKAMIFCVNIKHTIEVFLSFIDAGYNATFTHSELDTKKAEKNVQDFSDGKYNIIVNCGILTAGFDDQRVETIIMYRATKSLSLWLQICGRGSRPILKDGKPTKEKEQFKIIDLGGNIKRHWFWHVEREWSLDYKKYKEGVAPIKECPECFRVLHTSLMECECGYKFKKKKKKEVTAEVEQILPIEKEHYDKITAFERLQKERKYKQGWLIHQLNNLDLLDDFITLKGYSPKYKQKLIDIYGLK